MPSFLYDAGREGILDRTIDVTGDIRVALVRRGYVPSQKSHRVLRDIGLLNGRSTTLESKTYSRGVFDADDARIDAESADECIGVVLFEHTGDDTTARVVAFVDDASAGFPFTPAVGQGAIVEWNNGPDRIFKL